VNDFDYFIQYDLDTTDAIDYKFKVDPIKATPAGLPTGLPIPSPLTDCEFGDNDSSGNDGVTFEDITGTGADVLEAVDAYDVLLTQKNVVQNSKNFGFDGVPLLGFDPTDPGNYTITLEVRSPGTTDMVASTSINVIILDPDITPDIFYGDGNSNGDFVTSRVDGVELGLRAKRRNQGDNNADFDGTYNFDKSKNFCCQTGASCCNDSYADWNVDWHVNVDFEDPTTTTGLKLSDFTYELSLDYDPSAAQDAAVLDPITSNGMFAPDHAIGTNTAIVPRGYNIATYQAILDSNYVAQQSWNLGFFDDDGPFPLTDRIFDPEAVGIYDFSLKALKDGVEVNSVSITVVVF
jgi:hypothetical protein